MDTDRQAAPTAYFFTVTLEAHHSGALIEHADTLHLAFRACRDRYPFVMTAGVVLPDHMHCILTLPAGDGFRAARWRLIQGLFERVIDGRRGIWQREVEEDPISDDAELRRRVDDIHADPVRHGLVRLPKDWPYSSLHAYVRHGLRPLYWCADDIDIAGMRFARRAA